MVRKKQTPKHRALANFDDFYGSVFGGRWKNIRLALLCDHKYVAMVNNFGDTQETIDKLEATGAMNIKNIYKVTQEKLEASPVNPESRVTGDVHQLDQTMGSLFKKQRSEEMSRLFPENAADYIESHEQGNDAITFASDRVIDSAYGTANLYEYIPATKLKGMEDWVFESDHFKYYKTDSLDFPLSIAVEQEHLVIPEHLHLFTYEMGNVSKFPRSTKSVTGVSSHYHLDGASILPALFLDVQPGDSVLDACAAPGGKSLLLLQTLYPNLLVSNDLKPSRTRRIKNVFNEFVIDFEANWLNKRCFISESDARGLSDYNQYDRVLVDVPCTTDRHSVSVDENNLFKPNRVKERLKLPEEQAAILTNCLRLLKPGGTLVYSTCSLSPIQNDGVVHMALSKCFTEHQITATVK